MKNFNEIMTQSSLNADEQSFVTCHQSIMRAGSAIADNFLVLAQNLKKMKDDKLYLAAGFAAFADYSESAIGIKERQAYNYIEVVERFDAEFLQSTAKIGITKLQMLTSLSNDQVTEVVEKVDLPTVSTRELEAEVKALKAKLAEKPKAEANNAELKQLKESLNTVIKERDKLQKQVSKLEEEQEEDEAGEEVDSNTEEAVQTAVAQAKAEMQKALAEKNAQISELTKKVTMASDENLVVFKVKFDLLKNTAKELFELLQTMPTEKQEKLKLALSKLVESWGM